MYVLCVTVSVFCIVLCANCDASIKDNVTSILPKIFYIDKNYERCKTEGKLFCKVSIVLSPRDTNNVSVYWQIIEKSMKDRRAYNHNELFHAICVSDFCPHLQIVEDGNYLKNGLSDYYSKKYKDLGLIANVTDLNCSNHDSEYKAGPLDFIWLFCLIIYGIYVLYASIWDYKFCRNENKGRLILPVTFEKTYVLPFSVINNWEKLKRENTNPDFQNLKCIQGIRFYNMLLIIFCHTYSSFIGGYVQNTTYIEEIPNNPIRLGIRNLLVFLVQTFFLISAFLLSYHMFQIIDSTKVFNKKYILLTFLNRYLRIIPPVLTMIGFGSTIWMMRIFRGPIKDIYADLEYQRCQKNWWTSLLFINNHYNQHDMCYFTTWYLAADTQLYILSMVVFSIIWKLKHKTKTILTVFVAIGIFIPMAISYTYNLDVIYRLTPENTKNNQFRSFNFNAIYSSTYANMGTYMVGIFIGYAYFKRGNNIIFRKLIQKTLWWIGFFGLIILVVILSSYYYTRFCSAVLGGILKPLYALGIGIGIFGMSQQSAGLIKRICEWRPAIFLGNLTYSTYLVHYGVVFYRTATAKQPLYVSDYVLITSFIYDAVLSFICGFFMHILVEMPAMQLQNVLVPQIRSKRVSKFSNKAQ